MHKVIFPLLDNKAPAVPEGTDWRDYRGEAKTPLIGVMVPDGVIVLDVDLYKGVTHSDIENALGCELDWYAAELQETRNGGKHYAFAVPTGADMSNGSDVLGVAGFDTRSSGKGYIATGEGYNNLTFFDCVSEAIHEQGAWPELPSAALEKLMVNRVSGEDNDLLSVIVAQPLDITEQEALFYLHRLPDSCADDRSTWLKVSMAIAHQFGKAGYPHFVEFSKRCSEKFDELKNKKVWDSFFKSRSSNPVTFASVIELAGGSKVLELDKFEQCLNALESVTDKKQLTESVNALAAFKLDEINLTITVKALQKKTQQLVGEKLTESQIKKILRKSRPQKEGDFYEDYVFITATGEYMHRETKTTMGPRAFDVKHSRDTPADGDGNPQRATTYVDSKIECVHSGMYAPMFADIFTHDGVEYFNTYKPNTLQPKPQGEVVDMVKSHIAHLLPDPIEQQLVINYLAHNVQFTGKKIFWAMILQGVQGDGKSFFAEMMQKVLGQSNCTVISAEALDERYTAWAEGCAMVFFEELKLDNYKKYETINKLKPFITNPMISVRKMYRDTYEAINTVNYFALTNFKDALPIDDSDRRYCVLFSQWQNREKLEAFMADNPNYYSDLYEAMRSEAGQLLTWLLEHKIPDSFLNMSRAPATKAKEMMQDMAKSDDYLIVEDAIAEFECYDINDHVVNVTKLQKMVSDVFNLGYDDFPKSTRLNHILMNMGYHKIGRYKDADRKNQCIYCKDDQAKAIDFKDEIIALF